MNLYSRDVRHDLCAGAEVITANTYASSPLSFSDLGRLDEIEAIDRGTFTLSQWRVSQKVSYCRPSSYFHQL